MNWLIKMLYVWEFKGKYFRDKNIISIYPGTYIYFPDIPTWTWNCGPRLYGGSYTLSFYMYNTFVIPCQFTGARHKLSVFLLFVIHVSVFDHPNNDIFYSKLVIRK